MAFVCMTGIGVHAQQTTSETFRPMDDVNKVVDLTLDSLEKVKTARPVAGSSRKGDHPVLFLVGNSTMRTGTKGTMATMVNGAGVSTHISILTRAR